MKIEFDIDEAYLLLSALEWEREVRAKIIKKFPEDAGDEVVRLQLTESLIARIRGQLAQLSPLSL